MLTRLAAGLPADLGREEKGGVIRVDIPYHFVADDTRGLQSLCIYTFEHKFC